MLDSKKGYLEVRKHYTKMDTQTLEKVLAKLHKIRYHDNDLEAVEHFRIASAVLNKRQRSETGLIFHMQEFLR